MAKNLLRLPVSELQGKAGTGELLHFVMENGSVHAVMVIDVKSDEIKVKNSKGHLLHLPLAQINEIWADAKVV